MSHITCDVCDKSFSCKTALTSHKKWKHLTENNFICPFCSVDFKTRFRIRRHMKSCKVEGDNTRKKSYKCAECEFSVKTSEILLHHYSTEHDIALEKEQIQFDSINHFESWKSDMEENTLSRFIKTHGVYKSKNGSINSTYVCHRDGFFKHEGKGLRNLKEIGSNKINAHCPAKITISQKVDCSVYGVFFKTHIGHIGEIARLNLNKTSKEKIVQKISMHTPFKEILRELQNSEEKRINLLTRKDLHNIAMSYKLNLETIKKENHIFDRYISKNLKDKPKYFVLKSRHRQAQKMPSTYVLVGGNEWKIYMSDKNVFTVQKVSDCDCSLRCESCDSCIHNYKCSCADSQEKYNMCMHIHFICLLLKNNLKDSNDLKNYFQCTAEEQVNSNLIEEGDVRYTEATNDNTTVEFIYEYPSVEGTIHVEDGKSTETLEDRKSDALGKITSIINTIENETQLLEFNNFTNKIETLVASLANTTNP